MNIEYDALIHKAERLLGLSIIRSERIGGGRNSRVLKITGSDGLSYCLKEYFVSPSDPRDRLYVETESYSRLSRYNIDCIPEIIGIDKCSSIAIFSFISGRKLGAADICEEDIFNCAKFIVSLQLPQIKAGFSDFPNASDASFSLSDITADIDSRFERFAEISSTSPLISDFLDFIDKKLKPFYQAECEKSINGALEYGCEYDAQLASEQRILSPSDFGFHNLLAAADGTFTFFDFEYFGWDSPEKCINDFMLHPGFGADERLRACFKDYLISNLKNDETLSRRVANTYNLYGIKWCLIILNVFSKMDLDRRLFSAAADLESILQRQLVKADNLFSKLNNREYNNDHE